MILSIDQGTTGTTVLVINRTGAIAGRAYAEFSQIYPQSGWVSHNAEEIWRSTGAVIADAIRNAGVRPADLAGIGIANQRETTVLWDRRSGEPVHDAIVWQCRRTADLCRGFRERGIEEMVRKKTGLVIDPYFSATKIVWLLENVPGLRRRAENGDICFGTIDTYLVHRLTNGKVHATDLTNASRTMCFNIHTKAWDADLLDAFNIPRAILPEVHPSAHLFGKTAAVASLPEDIPHRRYRGRPASRAFRAARRIRGRRQEHLRHRLLRPVPNGPERFLVAERPAHHARVRFPRRFGLCP